MTSTEVFKEFYFKEIQRRNELDNTINLLILIISGITSIHVYFYSQLTFEMLSAIFVIISILTFISGLYSLFYLVRSFSNFFYNHKYQELADMNLFLEYEQNLLKENSKNIALEQFENHLNTELADCQSINFKINIKRTEDIAKSKRGIFWSIVFTLIFAVTFITSNYLEMNKKQETKKQETKKTETERPQITKMETKIVGPKSVKIMCSSQSVDKKKKKD